MQSFTVSAMIRFGWETFKKRPAFFIGIFILIWAIGAVSSELGAHVSNSQTPTILVLALAGVFINIVVSILLKMGTYAFFLKAHDAPEQAKVLDLWAPEMFWQYLLTSIVVGVIVVVGLILLIVPGIIWALTYLFAPYLVIDKKLDVSAALKESKRITQGHRWQLLGLLLALVVLNIVGAIALLVGLLVTVPVSTFALMHAYRTLEHSASEVTSAA